MSRRFSSSFLTLAVIAPLAAALAGLPAGCSSSSNNGEPKPSLTHEQLLDPKTCEGCHKDHYKEWSGSMHAYAAEDPVFLAMNKRGQRETNGQLGEFCVKCHAPMAVRMGATKDGLNLDTVDPKLKGVGCYFCHSVDAVEDTHGDTMKNPLHLANDDVMRGGFADPVANTAHRAKYSPLHARDQADSAKMCGECHDIVNGHGTKIERTFEEWQNSVFPHVGSAGTTCSQCHMDVKEKEVVAQAPGVKLRDRHMHTFPGVDLAMTDFPEKDTQKDLVQKFLDSVFQSALCVLRLGPNNFQIRYVADNVAAGHGFPSGSAQDRRVWFEVIAYDQAGAVLYQSGVVPEGEPATKVADPDMWMARDCHFDESGKEVHMFWEAASYEGNAFPAKVTSDLRDPLFYAGHIVQNFPRNTAQLISGVPDRVTVRARVMPVGLEVLDDLVASGDLDPKFRQIMAKQTFDIGTGGPVLEWTAAMPKVTEREGGAELQCVTNSNARIVGATRTPAFNKTKCSP
jgi:hypothetical protein